MAAKKNRILILYELSSVFTRLYRAAGWEAVQVDKQLDGSDARLLELDPKGFQAVIAFPPCTHLAGSGAQYWKSKGEAAFVEAMSTVDAVYRMVALYKPRFWFIENPVGRLSRMLGKADYLFDPCDFGGWLSPKGDAYTKRTCLWGKFKKPVPKPVKPAAGSWIMKLGGSSERTKNLRSATPLGFAKAFVNANH